MKLRSLNYRSVIASVIVRCEGFGNSRLWRVDGTRMFEDVHYIVRLKSNFKDWPLYYVMFGMGLLVDVKTKVL